MKVREIILDFTSLLDVIMIILFWFILHYQQQTQAQVAAAEQAAAAAVTAAEEREEAADALCQEAEAALAALSTESSVQYSNTQALLSFSQSNNIRISLVMEPEGWHLEVRHADQLIGTVTDRNSRQIGLRINEMLSGEGYAPEDTVLCELIFDSSQPGSYEAYQAVTEALHQIKVGNRHFYCNELDLAELLPAEGGTP